MARDTKCRTFASESGEAFVVLIGACGWAKADQLASRKRIVHQKKALISIDMLMLLVDVKSFLYNYEANNLTTLLENEYLL
jgi:predicted GTPase